MAYTQYNKLEYAYKKLAGKAHTSANRELSNETQGSLIQLSSVNTLFGQSLVTNALVTSNLYTTFSNAQSEVVAEKVRFEVVPSGLIIYTPTSGSGTYGIDKRGDGSPTNTFTNGEHLYFLKLSGSYQANSNNPKKGTGPFVDGYYLTGSNGTLQIIPEAFGVGYTPIVSSSTGNISAGDDIDWFLDTYAGVLFVQDYNGSKIPAFVDAYIYIGKYASEVISSGSGATGFPFSGSAVITGSLTISGSSGPELIISGTIEVTQGITGSLFGTASWANNAISASYAATASKVSVIDDENSTELQAVIFSSPATGDAVQLKSDLTTFAYQPSTGQLLIGAAGAYTLIGSGTLTTTGGSSSPYTLLNQGNQIVNFGPPGGGGVLNIYHSTVNIVGAITASIISASQFTGSLFGTASWAISASQAVSSSYAFNATSASYALSASQAISASYVLSASYAFNATSASYVATSSVSNATYVQPVGNDGTYKVAFTYDTATADYQRLNIDNGSGEFTYNPSTNVLSVGAITASAGFYGTSSWAGNTVSASYAASASTIEVTTKLDDTQSFGIAFYDLYSSSFDTNGEITSGVKLQGSKGLAYSPEVATLTLQTDYSNTGSVTISRSGINVYNLNSNSEFEIQNISGSILLYPGSGLDGVVSSVRISGSLNVTNGITGSLYGTASWSNNTISASYALTASSVNTLNQNVTINGNLTAGTSSLANLTVTNNAIINGDLFVYGSASVINVNNLSIEDKFILLNSGSTGPIANEGGIIVQTSASDGTAYGTALFYDQEANRWLVAKSSSVAFNATSITVGATTDYVVTVSASAGSPVGTPPNFGTGDSAYSVGQMYIQTDTSDIYIYA